MNTKYYTCSNSDQLAQQFIDNLDSELKENQSDLFYKPTIIVANSNLENWLTVELARKNTISAGFQFSFLEPFFSKFLDGESSLADDMDWFFATLQALENTKNIPDAESFRAIVFKDRDSTQPIPEVIIDMARHISQKFIRYEREHGSFPATDHWQYQLYLAAKTNLNKQSRLTLVDIPKIIQKAMSNMKSVQPLHFVGASGLTEAYMQALSAYSSHATVYLYQLYPYSTNKQDTMPWSWPLKKRKAILEKKLNAEVLNKEYPKPATITNNLQAFQSQLAGYHFALNQQTKPDSSVQLVFSPSLEREVETTVHHIFRSLEAKPELSPSDIVILVPNLDEYAPAFSRHLDPGNRIDLPHGGRVFQRLPYHFTDLFAGSEQQLASLLEDLLALGNSKITSRRELAMALQHKEVQNTFELEPSEVQTFLKWLDMADMTGNGKGELHFYSFEIAMRRIRLGLMTGEQPVILNDESISAFKPLQCGQQQELELLEKVCLFEQTVNEWQNRCSLCKSSSSWAEALSWLHGNMFTTDPKSPAERRSMKAYYDLLDKFDTWQLDLNWSQVCKIATNYLVKISQRSSTFLKDGLTISAHQPIRPVPYKHVYLLGVNAEGFGSSDSKDPFDILDQMNPGEQQDISLINRQENQRLMLLESIFCAKEKLVISALNPDQDLQTKLLSYIQENDTAATEQGLLLQKQRGNEHLLELLNELILTTGSNILQLVEVMLDQKLPIPVNVLPLTRYSLSYDKNQRSYPLPGNFTTMNSIPVTVYSKSGLRLLQAIQEKSPDIETAAAASFNETQRSQLPNLISFLFQPLDHYMQAFDNILYQARVNPDEELEPLDQYENRATKQIKKQFNQFKVLNLSETDKAQLIQSWFADGTLPRGPWSLDDELKSAPLEAITKFHMPTEPGDQLFRFELRNGKLSSFELGAFNQSGQLIKHSTKSTSTGTFIEHKLTEIPDSIAHTWYMIRQKNSEPWRLNTWYSKYEQHIRLADLLGACLLNEPFTEVAYPENKGKATNKIIQYAQGQSLAASKLIHDLADLNRQSPLAIDIPQQFIKKIPEQDASDESIKYFRRYLSGAPYSFGSGYEKEQRDQRKEILGDRTFSAIDSKPIYVDFLKANIQFRSEILKRFPDVEF